jgi:hypothetical protein
VRALAQISEGAVLVRGDGLSLWDALNNLLFEALVTEGYKRLGSTELSPDEGHIRRNPFTH